MPENGVEGLEARTGEAVFVAEGAVDLEHGVRLRWYVTTLESVNHDLVLRTKNSEF